ALGTVVAVPDVAATAGRTLVALGDSYASGVGTRTYYVASGACKRSPYAYPVVEARQLSAALTFVACAGATTAGVLRTQVAALSPSTTDVTVTVGGNDAGFRSVVVACAQPAWSSDCDGAIDRAQAYISTDLAKQLNVLYRAIRARAPAAQVIVAGYPYLFNGEDCNAGTWFSPAEEGRLNVTSDQLDGVLARRAAAHGFEFVDTRVAFTGHAVCASDEWINGLSNPVTESYHPNRHGQAGYAALVDPHLG
nr:SGNH/GDSL hydrolase family protein [Propionibacteriales bacterium]